MKHFQLKFLTDKLHVRWLQILNEFEKLPHRTTAHLADITLSTRRTIIKDLTDLRSYFDQSIQLLSSKTGYFFSIIDHSTYLDKKRQLIEDEPLFLIFEHIFYDELYSIGEWSDKLHLSESTIVKYLKSTTASLRPYNLRIQLDPVTLVGTEIDKRQFFCAFYYESEITPHTIFPSLNTQDAVMALTTLFKTESAQASSFGYFNYLLYITIERNLLGFDIVLPQALKHLIKDQKQTFDLAALNGIIQTYFDHSLTEDEAIYLFISITCRRKIRDSLMEEEFCRTYNMWPEIKEITQRVYQHIQSDSPDRHKDLILIESFFTVTKIRSLLAGSAISNIDDINLYVEDKFPREFDLINKFLVNDPLVKNIFPSRYLECISCNLTLHLEAIKEMHWGMPRTIAFVFEGNEYLCQYIETWSNKYFGRFHKVHYPDSNQFGLDYIAENGINLLVTNYPEYMNDFLSTIDCLLLKAIPDATDWNNLLNHINPKITRHTVLSNFGSSVE
ncbi:helix-turn-helix domain-containing protein [Enterococcus sp. DIV0876]|uniref:helix-turn-helix domain-containing protein n=1 Tax=Enterococcus sp. DIV0876 TaxID=2774633 RepID=UPI003D2FBCD6